MQPQDCTQGDGRQTDPPAIDEQSVQQLFIIRQSSQEQ